MQRAAAVLLVAHGAPEHLEDVPEFLAQILGAPAPPALVGEVRARYERIGGASPLTAASRRQAEALSRRLGLRVYLGMRYWHPFLGEAVAQAQADGLELLVAVPAAPQFGDRLLNPQIPGDASMPIRWAPSVHRQPLFVEALAEKLAPLAQGREVLFTAHSLPSRLAAVSPEYDPEARATAAAVAARCGLETFEFGYQSRGRGSDDWLGPPAEAGIDACAARGVQELVVAPLSFVTDNVEVLYDIDIHLREYARERGIRLSRAATPGDSSLFIEALAAAVRPGFEAAP